MVNSAYFKCFHGNSDAVCNEIKKGNKWEIDLQNKLLNLNLNKNSVAIEAGTHICTHTCLLADLCKTVYGFEPFPETYELALENLKLNNINNVILSNKALSNENDKTIKVEYHNPQERNIGGWGIHFTKDKEYTISDNFIDIKLITIDSLNLNKLDLIKLDVEGNELNVINGAIKTIIKHKPIIILEDWGINCSIDINRTKEKFNFLIEIGYKIENINSGSADFIFYPIKNKNKKKI